jgi:hypothetical protein
MNGRGILRETEHLSDEVFRWLTLAFVGFCLIAVPVVEVAAPSVGFGIPTWALIGCAIAGAALVWPWVRACYTLRRHTKRMLAETAKHGKGWAYD